jgi:hypothetical protein
MPQHKNGRTSSTGLKPVAPVRQNLVDRRAVVLALRLLKAERMGWLSDAVLQELLEHGASMRMLRECVEGAEGYHRGVN